VATKHWGSLIKPVAGRLSPLEMERHVDAAMMPSQYGCSQALRRDHGRLIPVALSKL